MVSEFDTLTKNGQRRHLDLAARFLLQDGRPVGFQFIARDVTERRSLEAQFRQSQKMEAVGRLAAGVAHDFNNLLTVIQGYCDLHLPDLPPQDDVRPALEAIQQAGKRAAGLTQQLLAFSRQQAVQPRTLDLNSALAEMKDLLARMIGEDVALEFHPDPELGRVRVDPGLLGQVVMNLAVNARDAMPGGGRLTIGTANVEIDQAFAQSHVNAHPGPYVMLSVTDTGTGMDEATQARIFDPFFTTKELGKGTGLGLATVYGIVQQFKGHIWVYSEPGKGTSFKIYLPRAEEAARPVESKAASGATRGSGETVLLVEDDPALCHLTRQFLEALRYRVLVASNSEEARNIAGQEPGTIHLLLTDLIMPGMTGRELAETLVVGRPEMKVLLMSGYGDHALLNGPGSIPDAAFIQKPFDLATLSTKLRAVLG
jgi:signal transduction histidine kinase